MKTSKKEGEIIGHIDGFQYGDFNNAGKIDPWRMCEYDWFLFDFLLQDVFKQRDQYMAFMRFTLIKISPEFYHPLMSMSRSCVLKARIDHAGKSSYWATNNLQDVTSKKELVSRVTLMVVVNGASRRPTAVPESLRDLVVSHKDDPFSPPRIAFSSDIPSDAFHSEVVVQHSDTDINQHLNSSAYMKMCIDCASKGATAGRLHGFKLPMSSYNIRALAIEFVREVNAGDAVEIICWNDTARTCTLHFVMRKCSDTISRCKVEWYANQHGDPDVLVRKATKDIFPDARY